MRSTQSPLYDCLSARRVNVAPCFIDLAPQCASLVRRQARIPARLIRPFCIAVGIIVVRTIAGLAPAIIAATFLIRSVTVIVLCRKAKGISLETRLRRRCHTAGQCTCQHQHQSCSFQCYIHRHLSQHFCHGAYRLNHAQSLCRFASSPKPHSVKVVTLCNACAPRYAEQSF